MSVKPIPDGYHSVTPYLIVENAASYLEFLKKALNANEKFKFAKPDGSIAHAEVVVGDSILMLSDSSNEVKPTLTSLFLYVKDTDQAYQQAIQAGAISIREPEDMFYGDRTAGVRDNHGNQWWFGTHIKDVSLEEIERGANTAN